MEIYSTANNIVSGTWAIIALGLFMLVITTTVLETLRNIGWAIIDESAMVGNRVVAFFVSSPSRGDVSFDSDGRLSVSYCGGNFDYVNKEGKIVKYRSDAAYSTSATAQATWLSENAPDGTIAVNSGGTLGEFVVMLILYLVVAAAGYALLNYCFEVTLWVASFVGTMYGLRMGRRLQKSAIETLNKLKKHTEDTTIHTTSE
jgi:hypothetical protein